MGNGIRIISRRKKKGILIMSKFQNKEMPKKVSFVWKVSLGVSLVVVLAITGFYLSGDIPEYLEKREINRIYDKASLMVKDSNPETVLEGLKLMDKAVGMGDLRAIEFFGGKLAVKKHLSKLNNSPALSKDMNIKTDTKLVEVERIKAQRKQRIKELEEARKAKIKESGGYVW